MVTGPCQPRLAQVARVGSPHARSWRCARPITHARRRPAMTTPSTALPGHGTLRAVSSPRRKSSQLLNAADRRSAIRGQPDAGPDRYRQDGVPGRRAHRVTPGLRRWSPVPSLVLNDKALIVSVCQDHRRAARSQRRCTYDASVNITTWVDRRPRRLACRRDLDLGLLRGSGKPAAGRDHRPGRGRVRADAHRGGQCWPSRPSARQAARPAPSPCRPPRTPPRCPPPTPTGG